MTARKAAAGILIFMAFMALPSPAQSRFPAVLDAKFQAAAEGRENVSTPLEMLTLLEKVWKGGILKEPYRKDLLEILAIPKDSPLRSGVPEGVDVAEKPGELEAVRCDSGIVMLPGRPYILCVMTTYLKRDTDGNPAIAKLSRLAFEHFSRLERSSEIGRVVSDK